MPGSNVPPHREIAFAGTARLRRVAEDMVAGTGDLMSRRVGEVVEATSLSFVAQSYRLYGAPPLGAFVRTDSPSIYGVVCMVNTEPLDSGRPVLARGEAAATEDEVFRNNPQLSRLLTSRFEVLVAGFLEEDAVHQSLPPFPPRVHAFVYSCCHTEIDQFTYQLHFLHLLLNSGKPAGDEVVAACLGAAAAGRAYGREFRLRAGKALAAELAGDVPRLNAILRRLSQ
ncbi:MAG: hypothetical protein AAB528_01040 [Chloroflexota bacterium]